MKENPLKILQPGSRWQKVHNAYRKSEGDLWKQQDDISKQLRDSVEKNLPLGSLVVTLLLKVINLHVPIEVVSLADLVYKAMNGSQKMLIGQLASLNPSCLLLSTVHISMSNLTAHTHTHITTSSYIYCVMFVITGLRQ